MPRFLVRWWCLAGLISCLVPAALQAQDVRLKYVGRYIRQDWHPGDAGPDHLIGVETIFDDYALTSSKAALGIVDLNALPIEGTQDYVSRSVSLDANSTVTRPDGYCYVNLRQGGLAVAYVNPNTLGISILETIEESGVYFEKMTVVGDRLYVAAHSYGIRIYDLTQPGSPVLIGSLETGFDDAFAIAVADNSAYVADGAGGLKVVDITDEAAPVIVFAEDPDSAPGTAEDILIIGDFVYVASGHGGVAVHPRADVSTRSVYDTPACAKHLAQVGDHLAVADVRGVVVFQIEPDGSLTPAASESGLRRRPVFGYTTRLWYGVSGWGTDRVVAADWDSLDVYQLVDPAADDQADITASTQRLRFPPGGGSAEVTISNDGSGPLGITSIQSTEATFSVAPASAVLAPGETLELTVTYGGGQPGLAEVLLASNDPDEDPLLIHVAGETEHPDPTEPAPPFTLPMWTLDHDTGEFSERPFVLDWHIGKIVYFQIFGSW